MAIALCDKYNFITNYRSEPGSSGSPIFDSENVLVIGIHKGGNKEDNNKSKKGLGIILKYAVEGFIKKKKKKLVNLTKIYILNQILWI